MGIDEFCAGCLRLKGTAKSFDIHCIIYENHRLVYKWQQFMKYLETGFLPLILKKTSAMENSFNDRLAHLHYEQRSSRFAAANFVSSSTAVTFGVPESRAV